MAEKVPPLGPHQKIDVDQLYPNLGRPIFSDKDPDRNRYQEESEEEEVEDEVDNVYGAHKDELFEVPRFTGVVEWFICLVFDVILLLLEAAFAVLLARSLYPHNLITEYRSILIVLALPAVICPLIWLRMSSAVQYKRFGTVTVGVLLISSVLNSPFFVYVWHLYQSALGSRRSAFNSKLLANTFRMFQAILTSTPLLLLNVVTLVSVLRSNDEDNVIDINLLSKHLTEVKLHGVAFFLSMLNVIRAASIYNERLSFTVLFGIISLPFMMLTLISRLMSLSIIIAFLDIHWIAIMFAALFFSNLLAYFVCRKRSKVLSRDSALQPIGASSTTSTSNDATSPRNSSSTDEDLIQAADSFAETSCCGQRKKCCKDKNVIPTSLNVSHRSGTYNVATGTYYTSRGRTEPSAGMQKSTPETCWTNFPKLLVMSIGSIVMPVGYSNDAKQHHPRIKGGLYLLLNYIGHMLIIGCALGYTIRFKVPNTIKGVSISNPSIEVQIPDSKIFIGAAGMDVALNMPKTKMNLGSMPAMSATLNTEASDMMHAIILPVILAVFCLPFVIMRAAMMELDCFIVHKKELGSLEEEKLAVRRNKKSGLRHGRDEAGDSLLETVLRNSQNKALKARLYVSMCCGVFGTTIFTLVTMAAGAFVYMSLH